MNRFNLKLYTDGSGGVYDDRRIGKPDWCHLYAWMSPQQGIEVFRALLAGTGKLARQATPPSSGVEEA